MRPEELISVEYMIPDMEVYTHTSQDYEGDGNVN